MTFGRLHYEIALRVPKVKEFFVSSKIDLAAGEHLNFSSLKTRSVCKGESNNFSPGSEDQGFDFKKRAFHKGTPSHSCDVN